MPTDCIYIDLVINTFNLNSFVFSLFKDTKCRFKLGLQSDVTIILHKKLLGTSKTVYRFL